MKDLLNRIDPTNDGTIDFYHFCEIIQSFEIKKNRKKEMHLAFEAMDTDQDGILTVKEL
jgi:Ca2+-binding EF-hand superfamily protein